MSNSNTARRVATAAGVVGLTVVGYAGMASADPASTVNVPAMDNIFGAGKASVPSGSGGEGTAPAAYAIPAGTTSLSVTATGTISLCDTSTTQPCNTPSPAGGNFYGSSNISDPDGQLSTYVDPNEGALVGVFESGAPSGSAPATYSPGTGTATPALDQTFTVGAGPITLAVPAGATALYLGIADANGFSGPAGFYSDNSGAYSVTITASTPLPPALPEVPYGAILPLSFLGLVGAAVVRHRRRSS